MNQKQTEKTGEFSDRLLEHVAFTWVHPTRSTSLPLGIFTRPDFPSERDLRQKLTALHKLFFGKLPGAAAGGQYLRPCSAAQRLQVNCCGRGT
jgi:hypothetical protein